MNAKRLEEVCRTLESLPKKGKFSLFNWFSHTGSHRPEKDDYCGTTACAIGWAMTSPKLRRAGLKKHEYNDNGAVHYFEPKFAGHSGWNAITHFFDLSQYEAKMLFLENNYPKGRRDRRSVIRRIRKFIRES